MPELYPGQTETIAANLRRAELYLQADEERLKITTDPTERAALMRAIAGRIQTVESNRRALVRCSDEEEGESARTNSLRIRLNEDELMTLRGKAQEQGISVSAYVRRACGL